MTRWYTGLEMTCSDGHERIPMDRDGPVAHGQSCLFECPTCGQRLLVQNAVMSGEPTVRVLDP